MSQTFPKDTPAINKHMIKMFYIIVGMQVETAVRFPIENIGMATAKMPPHSQCCEDRKKLELCYTIDENAEKHILLRKASWKSLRKHGIHI